MHKVTKDAMERLGVTKLIPLANKVIVRRDQPADVSEGGIALAPRFDKPNWCTVVATPKTVRVSGKTVKPSIKPGDRVFIRPQDTKPLNAVEHAIGKTVHSELEWCPYFVIELKGEDNPQPLEDKILVKYDQENLISEGGIHLPGEGWQLTSWKADTGVGEIVASNTNREELPVGTRIQYRKGEGCFVGDDLICLNLTEVLGVV